MIKFNIEQYKKHFPFIKELVSNFTDIGVREINEELLLRSFQNIVRNGNIINYCDNYFIAFFSKNGDYLGSPHVGISLINDIFVERVNEVGETIVESIDRLEIANSVYYIVVQNWGEELWKSTLHNTWDKLIIYKLPKNFNIPKFIDELKKQSEKEVQKEIDF